MGTDDEPRTENPNSSNDIYTQMRISSRYILACASNISITDEKDRNKLAELGDYPSADHDRHESSK